MKSPIIWMKYLTLMFYFELSKLIFFTSTNLLILVTNHQTRWFSTWSSIDKILNRWLCRCLTSISKFLIGLDGIKSPPLIVNKEKKFEWVLTLYHYWFIICLYQWFFRATFQPYNICSIFQCWNVQRKTISWFCFYANLRVAATWNNNNGQNKMNL